MAVSCALFRLIPNNIQSSLMCALKYDAKSISDAVTKFAFKCPSYMIESTSTAGTLKYDNDDDLDVDRDREEILLIGIKKINYCTSLYTCT